jgi:general secretion pathway protein I
MSAAVMYAGARHTSRRRAGGFSLLEVIAAILLLAVTFGALMQVAGGSIRLTQNASAHSEAAMWASSLLDSSFVLDPLHVGNTEGRFDSRYHWRMQVTPWAGAGVSGNDGAVRLYRIDLIVLWGRAPREQSARFSTLRAVGVTPGARSQ